MDSEETAYKPPVGATVERGLHRLTGTDYWPLFRKGKRTPTGYTSKSRMPKGYTPRILVPANKVPILLPEQIAEHEDAVSNWARDKGVDDVPSLRPKVNAQGNEYLPPEHFSLDRPRNEKITSPDLALSTEELEDIFAQSSADEIEEVGGCRTENSHIAHLLPSEKFKSNFADSSTEGDPVLNRGIIKNGLPHRQSNPSGLRGGSSTIDEEGIKKDLVRGMKVYSPNLTNEQQKGGWAFVPREEWTLPTNVNAVQNSSAFVNSLDADELALNAAKLEPNFRIEDFAREKEWGIGFAKRFQTAFNKKLAAWKEAGGDPKRIAAQGAMDHPKAQEGADPVLR
jgi:hypothetical protein